MKAYTFPALCPVCGGTVATPADALAAHSACMQLAARCTEWANAMKALASNWPEGTAVVTPTDTVAQRVRARMAGRT